MLPLLLPSQLHGWVTFEAASKISLDFTRASRLKYVGEIFSDFAVLFYGGNVFTSFHGENGEKAGKRR
jgi:hypothetical protein